MERRPEWEFVTHVLEFVEDLSPPSRNLKHCEPLALSDQLTDRELPLEEVAEEVRSQQDADLLTNCHQILDLQNFPNLRCRVELLLRLLARSP
jgi:hypothetical protein